MNKKFFIAALSLLMILGVASITLADDGSSNAIGLGILLAAVAIGCGFGIGIAAFGTGLAMGNAVNAALSGIARNPEASGKIQMNMILGLAFIESLCIYALVIAFLLVFKIPALKDIVNSLKSLAG